MTARLERILEEIREMTAEERQELRLYIDETPSPDGSKLDELDRRMLAEGMISRVPSGSGPSTQGWVPMEVQGKPLSESIIEDRR